MIEYQVLVRLLGPVRVAAADGRAATFGRSKSAELVAWLATHRARGTRTLARTALWDADVEASTFSNVVSGARRALAELGVREAIGCTYTEALPLHPEVVTDADLLTAALGRASTLAPAEARAVLAPPVELVEGVPFEGTGYLWPDREGITSSLVVLATSATAALAEQCLALGDLAGVFAATGRGLAVLAGHERLIALRMRAHALAGDRAGVRHEWASYARALRSDPWAEGEPSPELAALTAELLGRAA